MHCQQRWCHQKTNLRVDHIFRVFAMHVGRPSLFLKANHWAEEFFEA